MREVTHTKKSTDIRILAIGNKSQGWQKSKDEAIKEIEQVGNQNSPYYVKGENNFKIFIHVINDPKRGSYLRTDPDKTTKNNLMNLPDL